MIGNSASNGEHFDVRETMFAMSSAAKRCGPAADSTSYRAGSSGMLSGNRLALGGYSCPSKAFGGAERQSAR
jgi:hypothetical protein